MIYVILVRCVVAGCNGVLWKSQQIHTHSISESVSRQATALGALAAAEGWEEAMLPEFAGKDGQ